MSKTHLNITIDEEVIRKARKKFLNISESAEEGIKTALGIETVDIQKKENEVCFICSKHYPFATAEKPNEGLSWIYPDEKWICHNCLRKLSKLFG